MYKKLTLSCNSIDNQVATNKRGHIICPISLCYSGFFAKTLKHKKPPHITYITAKSVHVAIWPHFLHLYIYIIFYVFLRVKILFKKFSIHVIYFWWPRGHIAKNAMISALCCDHTVFAERGEKSRKGSCIGVMRWPRLFVATLYALYDYVFYFAILPFFTNLNLRCKYV